jgi:hypothetical protein
VPGFLAAPFPRLAETGIFLTRARNAPSMGDACSASCSISEPIMPTAVG